MKGLVKLEKPRMQHYLKKDTFRRGEVVHVSDTDDAKVLRRISASLDGGDPTNTEAVRRMLAMLADKAEGSLS